MVVVFYCHAHVTGVFNVRQGSNRFVHYYGFVSKVKEHTEKPPVSILVTYKGEFKTHFTDTVLVLCAYGARDV